MEYWGIYINGVWVTGMTVRAPDTRSAIDIDEMIDGHAILSKAKTFADLFGRGWDKVSA